MASLLLFTCVLSSQAPEQQLQRLQRTIHDYGNLARYHDTDLKLPLPAAGEPRVVFLGDSITDFWGRRGGQFFPGKPYINRGISGQVTPQMLTRFRQDVVDLKPKVVVILAGTNDIGGSLGPIPDDATKKQPDLHGGTCARQSDSRGPFVFDAGLRFDTTAKRETATRENSRVE